MKIFFLLGLMIIPLLIGCGKSSDGADPYAASIGGTRLPICVDVNHILVRVQTTTSLEGGPAFSTRTTSGVPIIVFNLKFMRLIAHSAAMAMFVYEHECGHHALGHIQQGLQNSEDIGQHEHFQQELAADCYAAQQLRALGYNSSSITDVIDDIYPWPKDPEHPSGKVRSRHVTACFKSTEKKK